MTSDLGYYHAVQLTTKAVTSILALHLALLLAAVGVTILSCAPLHASLLHAVMAATTMVRSSHLGQSSALQTCSSAPTTLLAFHSGKQSTSQSASRTSAPLTPESPTNSKNLRVSYLSIRTLNSLPSVSLLTETSARKRTHLCVAGRALSHDFAIHPHSPQGTLAARS